MLDEYFKFVESQKIFRFLHWNMRDVNYGFAAIEHRYSVLGGFPFPLPDSQKYDLSRILIDIYGVDYIGHPRMEKILEKNNIKPLDFLSGRQEADCWLQGNYVSLHRSTLRKVDVLANIADRVYNGSLKTNISWWKLHGGHVRAIAIFLKENVYVAAMLAALAILGFFWTVFA